MHASSLSPPLPPPLPPLPLPPPLTLSLSLPLTLSLSLLLSLPLSITHRDADPPSPWLVAPRVTRREGKAWAGGSRSASGSSPTPDGGTSRPPCA